ncbi:MAG: type IV pilus secretin PilQ [Pseudomonadota bacterium]
MTKNPLINSSRAALAAAALVLTLFGAARAQDAAEAEPAALTLDAMDAAAMGGDQVQITLTLSADAPEPVVFTTEQPARLSLDLPGVTVALTDRIRRIGIGAARSLAAAQAKGRTRVVLELSKQVPYEIVNSGKQITITLQGKAVAKAAEKEMPEQPVPAPRSRKALAATGSLNHVDFRRGEKGEGRVIVTLSDPKMAADMREEGGRVIARFNGAEIEDSLLRRLDVLDFATPVKFIDITRSKSGVEVAITPVANAEFEQAAYQAGGSFTVELQPLSADKKEKQKRDRQQYEGERITLSFQSVDVRSLLQIIADVAGTNMVISDSVQGEVAMRLENVPWDQALDIILRTKGLGLRQQGNVMLVAPLAELQAREKAEALASNEAIDLAPLRSEMIQINYAKASDLAALLKSGESSLLSSRGKVTVDERTNTLLVLETREKLADVRTLISKLDIPVRQVLIESRIVIANDDYRKDLGARFGASGREAEGNVSTGTSTNLAGAQANAVGADGAAVAQPGTFNVNLPAAAANPGIAALAILGRNFRVDLELAALQAEGRGETVSSPRVITANSKTATIKQGSEIPYVTPASGTSPATVSFKEALLKLDVTPFINPDDSIVMDLKVNKDEPDFTNLVLGNPPLRKREVQTSVLVQNGETVVLGGIFETVTQNQRTKVPVLGDIPGLGRLFRSTTNINNKSELLIFVTPKILGEGLRVE